MGLELTESGWHLNIDSVGIRNNNQDLILENQQEGITVNPERKIKVFYLFFVFIFFRESGCGRRWEKYNKFGF